MSSVGGVSTSAAAMAAKPRLMILKMVLENFKSYGGVKEIGPFHKSFSSVVGPNGSGKSNVIDAMLFVFGKRASKMRMTKVSELIHKSAEYPDLDYSRVSVYFHEIIDTGADEDAYTVVPDSQFVVTRTAHRNNSSKYYIDKAVSNFTEVTTLLKGRGIDLDNNRFLILQGEVEQISMMKPKAVAAGEEGLLEYLEDIIGSNVYVTKIAEAEKVVETLSTERSEKLNRVKAAEKEVSALESSKTEAESLLRKERDMQRQQSVLCQKVIFDSTTALKTSETKYTDVMTKLNEARKSTAECGQKHAATTESLNAATKASEEAAKKLSSATEKRANAERDDIRLKENLQHSIRNAKKAEESIQKEAVAYAEACATVERGKTSVPALEATLVQREEELKTEQAGYDAVLSGLQGETEGLRKAMEAKQRELGPASEAATIVGAKLDTAKTEVRLLRERAEAGGKEIAAVTAQISDVEKSSVAKREELEGAKKEQAAMQTRRTDLLRDLEATTAAEGKLTEAVKETRSKVEEAKAAFSSEGAGNAVESKLRDAAKKGGPLAAAGFYGRLGDLGAIDAKYDVAISTACGALNWLVVDTAEGAQQCVEYMRAKSLGRAKFICLDKIQWVKDRVDKFSAPASAPRLYDLVRVKDERFRLAFYFALRDTLVADTLDEASRIAYSGPGGVAAHRVVTLTGELFDTTGTMSGGGKVAKKGGMSATIASSISPEELVAAEKELYAATTELTAVRTKKNALITEQKEIEKALPRVATRISKLQMELTSFVALKEELSVRVSKLSGSASGASPEERARITELEGEVVRMSKEFSSLSAISTALEAEVSRLQKQILEAGGEKVRRGKARCDRARETVEETEKALTKIKADIKAAEKTAEKAKKVVEKAKADIMEARGAIEKLKQQSEGLVDVAMEAEKEKKEAEEARAAAEKALAAVRTEALQAEKEMRKLKESERDLTSASDEAEAICMGLKKKVSQWQSKFDALKADYAAKIQEAIADKEADMLSSGEITKETGSGVEESKDDGADPSKRSAKVAFDEPLALAELPEGTLKGLTSEDIQHAINMAEAERDSIAKRVNMSSIAEFRTKNREYLRRVADLDHITQARDAARKQWETMRKQRLDEFMSGFSVISLRLKEMYQMITLGGDAELELVDTCDPFAEGILFQVRPPKKSWKNISNLSGGEKTLSSLALVFALHHYKPTPLYVMDEIDAALDFKNVSIVANYIKERTRDAQFIIISLRNNMFELADRLVGIYKTLDVTKSITINPKKIAEECLHSASSTMATASEDAPAAAPTKEASEAAAKPKSKKLLGDKANVA